MTIGRSHMRRSALAMLSLLIALAIFTVAAAAQDFRTYTKKGSFEDAKLDLSDAITKRGLVVDFTGNVGKMLERTGKDVGSTKTLYKNAEYMTFCSAQLSRAMMEADIANAAFCPFVLYIYESSAKPGEVVIGYRRMPAGSSSSSKKALADVNAMLDGIAKEAAK